MFSKCLYNHLLKINLLTKSVMKIKISSTPIFYTYQKCFGGGGQTVKMQFYFLKLLCIVRPTVLLYNAKL